MIRAVGAFIDRESAPVELLGARTIALTAKGVGQIADGRRSARVLFAEGRFETRDSQSSVANRIGILPAASSRPERLVSVVAVSG